MDWEDSTAIMIYYRHFLCIAMIMKYLGSSFILLSKSKKNCGEILKTRNVKF